MQRRQFSFAAVLLVIACVLTGISGATAQAAAGPVAFGPPSLYAVGISPLSIAVGDFNGDADPDLAIANAGTNFVSVLLGSSGGTFTGPTNFVVGQEPYSIATADFNGDSDPDLVTANWRNGDVSILLGGPGGTFGAPLNIPVALSSLTWVATSDFNGDGDPDIVVSNNPSGRVLVLLGWSRP